MATTPDQALDALRALREALEAAIATDDADAIRAAFEDLDGITDLLAFRDVDQADDAEAWAPVAEELHALMAWLDEPVEDAKGYGRKAMTREEKVRLAVAIATRGRGMRRRRRTPGDAIFEAFEAGVGHLLRGSWAALKLTVRGIAAVSRVAVAGAVAGAVAVREYYRNGRRVRAYTRDAPGKSWAGGAHLHYR